MAKSSLSRYEYEDYKIAFPHLEMRDKLSYIEVECPSCGQMKGYIRVGEDFLNCNRRNKCGTNINLISYYAELHDITYLEALQKMTGDKNLKLKPKSTLDIIWDILRNELPDTEKVVLYLKKRNITLEEAKKMKFGAFTQRNKEEIIKLIEKYCREKKVNIPSYIYKIKDDYSLALPITKNRKIFGVLLRDITGLNKATYLNLVKFPKDTLYGVERQKNQLTFIFEGKIDSAIVSLYTDYNVKYESGLTCSYELGKNYILAYDQDVAGEKKTYKTILENIEDCNESNIGVLKYPSEKKDMMEVLEGAYLTSKDKKIKVNQTLKNIIPFSQFIAENYMFNGNLICINSISSEWAKMVVLNDYKKHYEKMNDIYKANFLHHLAINLKEKEEYLKKILT